MSALPFHALQGRGSLELQVGHTWIRLSRQQIADVLADLFVLSPREVHAALLRIASGSAHPGDAELVRQHAEQLIVNHVASA